MALGVVNNTVRLENHNPAWAQMAITLIEELKSIMGEDAIDIRHVGSTAIYGIPAKPLIDVAVGVKDVNIYKKYVDIFKNHNINLLGDLVEEQMLFCKSTQGRDDRTHHIHFVEYNSYRWENYQNMRDYCNSHPVVAKAYGDLKSKLANEHANERSIYRDSKHDFIEETVVKAREWRSSLSEDLSSEFVDSAKKVINDNLMTMSRTANGNLDLSASVTKADAMQITDNDKAAELSKRNFANAIDFILDNIDIEFKTAMQLREFIERVAGIVNKDMVKDNCLYRSGADSQTKTYTLIRNMEEDSNWFYEQLFNMLNMISYNPVRTAAFLEYYMNMRIHMWADGCGKTSMILAAFIMMRSRCMPVKYHSRSEYYSYDSNKRLDCNCEEDKECYTEFEKYYWSLFL